MLKMSIYYNMQQLISNKTSKNAHIHSKAYYSLLNKGASGISKIGVHASYLQLEAGCL